MLERAEQTVAGDPLVAGALQGVSRILVLDRLDLVLHHDQLSPRVPLSLQLVGPLLDKLLTKEVLQEFRFVRVL